MCDGLLSRERIALGTGSGQEKTGRVLEADSPPQGILWTIQFIVLH